MIRLFDVLWEVKNAGPSPVDNRRTELYFGGCKRAMEGNACPDCFNPLLWNGDVCRPRTPESVVQSLNANHIPKYVTIVGGEPTDQLEGLKELGRILKEHGYHIMLFSWRSVEWMKENLGADIINFDIIVTDPYVKSERIYSTEIDDGIHNVIGSGNQRIFLPIKDIFYYARDVKELILHPNNELEVVLYGTRQTDYHHCA